MKVFVISAIVLICIGMFLVMNISNATYFKTHDGVVLAYAAKSPFRLRKNTRFPALTIGAESAYLFDHFDHLYIKFGQTGFIDLGEPLDVDKFNIATEAEVYKPVHYPDSLAFYTHPSGISLIVDEQKKVLRFSVRYQTSDPVFIGTDSENLKELPVAISDLREMFGDGDWYKKFNM